MIYSLRGPIVNRTKDQIAIDLGNIAYELFVPHPEDYVLAQEYLVYVVEVLTQDDHYLAGFSSRAEKEAFVSLTGVRGIGPKTAISALSATTPDELFAAIAASDAKYLKKLPGIGPKAASQIILDLQGKLVQEEPKVKKDDRYPATRAALKSLGFKVKEIDPAISALPDGLDDNTAIRTALRSLRKDG